jgi:hypothetical protein
MIKKILVLHHSHYDFGYVHPPVVERELQVRFFRRALTLLESDPGQFWCSELTRPVLDWLQVAGPAEIAKARQFVAEGRLGTGALLWHSTPLSDLEGLRHLTEGAPVVREALGDPCRVAFQHDVNGIPWPAVGVMLDAGIDLFSMAINVHQGGCAVGRHKLFRWCGPDGRHITVLNGDHYNQFCRLIAWRTASPETMSKAWADYQVLLEEWKVDLPFLYITATMHWGSDNNPPNEDMPALIEMWNREKIGPPMEMVTPEGLRAAVGEMDPASLPEFSGDWTDFWNFGSGSSATHTALSRRARTRLRHALAISPKGVDAGLAARAREEIVLFNEHTWGSSMAGREMLSVEPVIHWDMKAAFASNAAALADVCLRDSLHELTGNSEWGKNIEGVLVVNPNSAAVEAPVRTLSEWQSPEYIYQQSTCQWIAAQNDWRAPTWFAHWGRVSMPPRSWRMLSWDELGALPADGIEVLDGSISAGGLRLDFDPASGEIRKLTRLSDGWVALGGNGDWKPLQLVRESVTKTIPPDVDPRSAYFLGSWVETIANSPWAPEWPATREAATARSVRIEKLPGSVTLVRSLNLPGWNACELHISLSSVSAGVTIRLLGRVDDETWPAAYYLTFPLGLPADWRCHFDTAGSSVELDAEQLPGACRDWVTVDHSISMHREGKGATLVCPDAPLVMPGGFGYALNRKAIPRPANPLLLAWPLNTYWQTNFRASQPGPVDLQWRFHVHGSWSPETAACAAQSSGPLYLHPLVKLPAVLSGKL